MHNPSCLKIIEDIRNECTAHITLSQEKAKRFFKTSANSYGEHDKFLGITVPNLRKIAKKYYGLALSDLEELLKSKYNEERLLALLILVHQYEKADILIQERIFLFYLKNINNINNWNLVDSSAHFILGHYLWDKDRAILYELSKSSILWKRRIAIVATWYFIRKGDLSTTFDISRILIDDKHDLIHKATGWMLRETGKKDEKKLVNFLIENVNQMPKTMLRYATERLSIAQRMDIKA